MRVLGIFLAVMFFSGTAQAQNKTELLWLGQAGFQAALQGSPYKVTR